MRKTILALFCLVNFHILSGQSNYDLGIKEYDNDHFENAISYFNKAIDKKDKTFESYLERGMAYLFLGDAKKSKEDLDRAYEINPQSFKVYMYYGRYYSSSSQFGQALENYNKALEKNPKAYYLYGERAGAKSMLEMHTEALVDANIAVEKAPKDYNRFLNKGFVEMRMDKYSEAIEDLTRSLAIKESQKGYGNRGTSYALSGQYDAALQDFEKSLKYNPDDPLVLYFQGQVLLTVGQRENACKSLLRSKQLGNDGIDDIILKAKCSEASN